MAGYTRQDTGNNISNGNVIDADDFDAEYNALEAGFNASTGHKHDGTAGEGAPITKVGPSQDLVVSGTSVTPKTTNTLDLGTASVQYKNAWFDGTVDTDALTVSANATVGGTLGVTGILTATGGVTGDVTGTVSDVSNHDTDDISEGSTNLYYTDARARSSVSATGSLSYVPATGVMSFTQGDTDTVSEGSTNLYYTTARATTDAKAAISVTDSGGDGSLAYSAGAITYTGPSAAETRAHFSGGTGVSITNGTVAVGQAVATDSNVTFNDMTVAGNLTVSGTTTTASSTNTVISDTLLELGNGTTGSPANDSGIVIERGERNNAFIGFDESADKFKVGTGTFTGSSTGNLSITTGTLVANIEGNIYSGSDDDITVRADSGDGYLKLDNSGGFLYDYHTLKLRAALSNSGQAEITSSKALDITTTTGSITLDSDYRIYLDSTDGQIDFLEAGITRGSIDYGGSSSIKFKVNSTEEMRLNTSGVLINNGLYVGDVNSTPTDNEIYAVGNIESGSDLRAADHVYVGEDLIMQAGASSWKFEIGTSNELVIYYGATKLFKLDTSGNLTVIGTVTPSGTI